MPHSSPKRRAYHPFCTDYPAIDAEGRQRIKESIQQFGCWQRIPIDEDGLIVDGRTRYEILSQLAMDPEKCVAVPIDFKDDVEKLGYVMCMNSHRRHLTKAQLTAAAVACG